MSELSNVQNTGSDVRWRLLTTVSAAALLASVCAAQRVKAADETGRPQFWIELGGQFADLENSEDAFLPPFLLTTPRPPFETASPTELEKGPHSSWDGTAKIAFEPAGTDWIFSLGIRYGKSSRHEDVDQLTNVGGNKYHYPFFYDAYQNIRAQRSESHAILDFQAGKDVGLGMFGHSGTSIVSFGVRYAQFDSRSSVRIASQPANVSGFPLYQRFYASFAAKRKFTGIGPSLSWDASANLIGIPAAGGISFDWGVNGAVLFGRQRAQVHHQTTNNQVHYNVAVYQNYQTSASPSRSKQVIVPNLGGFAGVSWRYTNAKVSLGYRADFFFGAMDGGIDTAHKENIGFYGPFASVSVGIGG